ncbi:MAG TPA: SxtJ family membrane protein [Pyrinomonadaceae bacterium]
MTRPTHSDSDAVAVTDAQARKSALIVGGVLVAIAAWNFYRGRMTAVAVLGGIGALLLLVGLFVPVLARAFHTRWMQLAALLGYVNSRILLTIMYYGVFMPYGVVSRLFGRDPLNRRRTNRDTYWVARKTTRQTKEQFERLF